MSSEKIVTAVIVRNTVENITYPMRIVDNDKYDAYDAAIAALPLPHNAKIENIAGAFAGHVKAQPESNEVVCIRVGPLEGQVVCCAESKVVVKYVNGEPVFVKPGE